MDVVDAFSTDGELITYNLVILKMTRVSSLHIIVRRWSEWIPCKNTPELEEVLNLLAGKISDSDMQQLNYQVKEQKKDAAQVAKDFLQEKGLV